MIGAWLRDRRAAAALEFAIVVQPLVLLFLFLPAAGLALWTRGALQEACEETARCAAIGGSQCAAAPSGCDSAVAIVCYAEAMANQRGVGSVTAAEVTALSCSYGGVAFTCVTITHPFTLIFATVNLTSSATFPNPT